MPRRKLKTAEKVVTLGVSISRDAHLRYRKLPIPARKKVMAVARAAAEGVINAQQQQQLEPQSATGKKMNKNLELSLT